MSKARRDKRKIAKSRQGKRLELKWTELCLSFEKDLKSETATVRRASYFDHNNAWKEIAIKHKLNQNAFEKKYEHVKLEMLNLNSELEANHD